MRRLAAALTLLSALPVLGGYLGGLHPMGAVSYTHLRAHETVLDLVCRLLLEKKTNHKYSARSRSKT